MVYHPLPRHCIFVPLKVIRMSEKDLWKKFFLYDHAVSSAFFCGIELLIRNADKIELTKKDREE